MGDARRTIPAARDHLARALRLCLSLLIAGLLGPWGCSQERAQQRAREAAERVRESLPDVDARALAQKVEPTTVAHVQELLARLHEYQGEIHGKLDRVTVNAIQAFQRSAGLEDDGILDEETLTALERAARR